MKVLFTTAVAVIFLSSCSSKISENVAGSTTGSYNNSNVAASSDNASQNTKALQSGSSSDAKAVKSSDVPNARQVNIGK